MFSPFKLKSTVGRAYRVDPKDTIGTKKALRGLGHYQPPTEYGITDFTDRQMFEGLERFQKQNGLTPDGVARPGGPTELALRSNLARVNLSQHKNKNGVKIKPRVFGLSNGVGEGQQNTVTDKRTLKNALTWSGNLTPDEAARDDDDSDVGMSWGLWRFQRQFNLTQDGIAKPGGETERTLNHFIAPLVQQAQLNIAPNSPPPEAPAEENPPAEEAPSPPPPTPEPPTDPEEESEGNPEDGTPPTEDANDNCDQILKMIKYNSDQRSAQLSRVVSNQDTAKSIAQKIKDLKEDSLHRNLSQLAEAISTILSSIKFEKCKCGGYKVSIRDKPLPSVAEGQDIAAEVEALKGQLAELRADSEEADFQWENFDKNVDHFRAQYKKHGCPPLVG